MHVFDLDETNKRLERLDPAYRVIFACATAQRWVDILADTFATEVGSHRLRQLQAVLGTAWASVGATSDELSLQQGLENAFRMAPDDEDDEPYEQSDTALQNTALLVAQAVQTALTAETRDAVETAVMAYSNADWLADECLAVDYNDEISEGLLLNSGDVQRELESQRRDLESVALAQSLAEDVRDTRQRMKRTR